MPEQSSFRKPEVMSPAGHWPQLHAAVEAGADSVYFGLRHFTARAKVGFGLDELPEAMRTLHLRGARGYITFNSLVFDHELEEAARTLAAIAEAGVDAIIVQDLGILKLARAIAPDLEIHGSTQMSISSADGVRLAQSLGVSRVTLARELSLDDVRAIRRETDCELEIFVHGALCVSYSGQCFSSEAWGGRSANRGQCAQGCRLPYDLIVDGLPTPTGDARYLLSPEDLYALRQMPEIVRIGISALKIEGRYKDAGYVALATSAYRKAVDEAWAGVPLSVSSVEEIRLGQVYSRGLGPHFITGTNHQAVVRGRAPRHRGIFMGRVKRVSDDAILIETAEAHRFSPLKPGDGIVFDAADWRSPEEREEGGRLYQVAAKRGPELELRFGNGALNFARIRPGDLVWRTDDPEIEKCVRALPDHKQPVRVRVTAREGEPLVAVWELAGRPRVRVEVSSAAPLAAAQSRSLDRESLLQQFGRLGNTAYCLESIEVEIVGRPFAPASLLNQMRREAVEKLAEEQARPLRVEVLDPARALAALAPASHAPDAPQPPELHVLVRTQEQLDAALELGPASITLDYLDLYGLRPSLERVRASGITPRVASPRILKPGEERIVEFLVSLDCAILVRSTGLLRALQDRPRALIGDFSLNAANAIGAEALLSLGLTRITPTHDLNAAQVAGLAHSAGAGRIEAIAYQHLPVFHTEHCVFCRFLSQGTSYRDCGRPCEKHSLELRDVAGRLHPVMADVGCRNTVFGAEAQQAGPHLENWLLAGIRHFRVEFAHETAEQVSGICGAFQSALSGAIDARQLERELQAVSPGGTTQGSLFVPADYLTLPVLQ